MGGGGASAGLWLGGLEPKGLGPARRLGDLWTSRDQEKVFIPESIGNESEPGELKHLSTRRKGHQRDSVSSGERTRTRPMLWLGLPEPVGKPGRSG